MVWRVKLARALACLAIDFVTQRRIDFYCARHKLWRFADIPQAFGCEVGSAPKVVVQRRREMLRHGVQPEEVLNALDLKRKKAVRKWTPEEDQLMMDLVAEHGTRQWNRIGLKLPGRNGKQCRER